MRMGRVCGWPFAHGRRHAPWLCSCGSGSTHCTHSLHQTNALNTTLLYTTSTALITTVHPSIPGFIYQTVGILRWPLVFYFFSCNLSLSRRRPCRCYSYPLSLFCLSGDPRLMHATHTRENMLTILASLSLAMPHSRVFHDVIGSPHLDLCPQQTLLLPWGRISPTDPS